MSLKILLTNYRKIYREQSYRQLYDIYVKEIEENDLLTHEEKLHWYTWKTMQLQMMSDESDVEGKEFHKAYLAIAIGTLLMLGTGVLVKKGKSLQKS